MNIRLITIRKKRIRTTLVDVVSVVMAICRAVPTVPAIQERQNKKKEAKYVLRHANLPSSCNNIISRITIIGVCRRQIIQFSRYCFLLLQYEKNGNTVTTLSTTTVYILYLGKKKKKNRMGEYLDGVVVGSIIIIVIGARPSALK